MEFIVSRIIKSLLCFMFVLVSSSAFAGDDGNWMLSASYESQSASGPISTSQTDPYIIFGMDGAVGSNQSNGLTSYSLEYRFAQYFGISYAETSMNAPVVAVVPPPGGGYIGSEEVSSNGSFRGHGVGFEAHVAPFDSEPWIELLATINYENYSVQATGIGNFGTGVFYFPNGATSVSQSGSETFLGAGVRLVLVHHVGLQLLYNDYTSPFNPTESLGLYLEF